MTKYTLDRKRLLNLIAGKYPSLRLAAKAMGINHSYLSRVLAGKQEPGKKFIEGILSTFKGVSYEDMFYHSD